jgi:hypothetical protein
MCAGVSCSTIKKTKTRKEKHPDNRLASPGKERRIISDTVVYADDFYKCVIRNTIQDFCVQEKKSSNHPEAVAT